MPHASLFSLMETASGFLKMVSSLLFLTISTFFGGKGGDKSLNLLLSKIKYKTINLFPYLLTVLRTDMSYLSGSDLADDGKEEREKEDFYWLRG